jgi:HD-like signal output (HDOD) protein
VAVDASRRNPVQAKTTFPEPAESGAPSIGAELRARLSRGLLDSLVDKAVTLPMGSQPALARVASLCQYGSSSIAQIATAAAADPSFAATLLRIANSAASAPRWRVENLPTAITRLGTRMVGTLAIAAPTLRLLRAPEDELNEARREIHRHAIRVGVVARELAPPSIHPETALAAGLVHNLGLGVLSLYAKVGLRRVLELAAQGTPLSVTEPEVFGFTHAELGGMLAREWSYPEFLVVAVEEHDSPSPSSPLAALVQVADLLVREAGVGVEPPVEVDADVARHARLITYDARARAESLLHLDPNDEEAVGQARPDELSGARLIQVLDELQAVA